MYHFQLLFYYCGTDPIQPAQLVSPRINLCMRHLCAESIQSGTITPASYPSICAAATVCSFCLCDFFSTATAAAVTHFFLRFTLSVEGKQNVGNLHAWSATHNVVNDMSGLGWKEHVGNIMKFYYRSSSIRARCTWLRWHEKKTNKKHNQHTTNRAIKWRQAAAAHNSFKNSDTAQEEARRHDTTMKEKKHELNWV